MLVAGIDEVGRGPLAGPLLVVATLFDVGDETPVDQWNISPPTTPILGVKDSKKFYSREKREQVASIIPEFPGFRGQGRGVITPQDIDSWGMGESWHRACARALECLPEQPDLVLMDGMVPVRAWKGAQLVRPKADALWWPVAAASVLAKVERDRWMIELGNAYPGYDFAQNMGYGTVKHREAIKLKGVCPIHRRSFLSSILKP